ncbi:hypothetical protein Sinac_4054 [Singulisphaera acidiphila DSM 18658]|uniref:Uncharacterized protein n=1 Tax=Singulisphaera acidiphila (strain ATCC BAA-1392 / DSM 18658 / VKM B-2454 / MOB10) TaxID=886293 RepID=L0DFX5_SINAD|nr:hypothetical protein Sinac_4054 [Singulisphaera acidiphila DSM 18658]
MKSAMTHNKTTQTAKAGLIGNLIQDVFKDLWNTMAIDG